MKHLIILAIFFTSLSTICAQSTFPIPHDGNTIKDFLNGNIDKKEIYGFETVVISSTFDNHQRPIAKVKIANFEETIWCVYIIKAETITEGTKARVLGFLKTGKVLKEEIGFELEKYGIKESDPVIFTSAYLDLTNTKAAYTPGSEKDWENWSKGIFPKSRKLLSD